MFKLKSRCYNGGKRHKFEPRYSEKSTGRTPTQEEIILRSSDLGLRGLIFYQVYIYDVCVWCGKRISKEEKDELNR